MLETLSQTISNTDFTVNRTNIVRWLRPFAANTPTFYLLFVIPFAFAGYFALLLFPLLSLWLFLKLTEFLFFPATYQHWTYPLIIISVLIPCSLISIALARLRFASRAGVSVSIEKTPRLSRLVKGLQQHYGNPRLEKILITRRDEVKISHTPVSGFPIRFRNTLEIGLSALLCTSPIEFRGMLAREVAKLARQKNPVTGWMLSLTGQWENYRSCLERRGNIILKPLTLFFHYYSPLYNAVAFFAARRAETRADRYTLEVMEDDDAITSMIQTIIFQHFLREQYWPLVINQPRDGKHRIFLPYKKMSQTMRKNVKDADIERWVEQELCKFGDTSTTLPPLQTRLHLLGHEKPVYPPALERTAAEEYLDEAMLQLLINSFDKSWIRKAGLQH